MSQSSKDRIRSIIGNRLLAAAIHRSVTSALQHRHIHLVGGKTVQAVFKRSLDAAIRDIEEHPRGKLFRRLIEYGPHNPDDPEALTSDGETTLSDPECGSCVEFIYSHMVNRFKGELAELLALEPCVALVQRLRQERRLPSDAHLYWGEMVQERRRTGKLDDAGDVRWGSFTKGADGLLVEEMPVKGSPDLLRVHGVVEIKSMRFSTRKVAGQIESHIARLRGGIKIGAREWGPDKIDIAKSAYKNKSSFGLIRVIIVPSAWKLSREWRSVKTNEGRAMAFPEPSEPPIETQFQEMEPNLWKITLAWSQEAISQAAYEMTFWYMSQVGRHVYTKKNMPKGWESMTPEEAGYNAIKMMLYYIPLRYISKRQERLAIRLYNVYGFGYPSGADSKEMLWPEDFPGEEEKK